MRQKKEYRNINGIQYLLIYKDMKSISMRINKEGMIEAHAPYFVRAERVDQLIIERLDWFQKRMNLQANRAEMLEMEDTLVLWGEKLPVTYLKGSKRFEVFDRQIVVYHPEVEDHEKVKNYLESQLKKLLMEEIEKDKPMCEEMIADYRISSPTIRYRDMSSRWGSCMVTKKMITMNTRLVHYPKECTAYVLLHEYTHLIVPNHSERFYQIIAYRMPDYRLREKRLNGYHFFD